LKALPGYSYIRAMTGLAFLVTDIATSEVNIRSTNTRISKKMNRFIGHYSGKSSYKSRDDMYAITTMMIGGFALSRAVDDKQLVERILESFRHAASRLANRVSNRLCD
jgi:hypothetical protein